MIRRLAIAAALAVIVLPKDASAYPDFIAKGYTNCITCHYSPTGGGFANAYGTGTQQAFFPDVAGGDFIEKHREKASVTGYNANTGDAEFQVGLGADTRVMFTSVPAEEDTSAGFSFFPMLLEVGGVAAYGKILAYGSIGPKSPEAEGIGYKIFSREHWLQFRFTEAASVRAGRMVLPFGIRQPDHTTFTRSTMGLGYYGQSYAAEADYVTERVAVALAGFGGDLTEAPAGLREQGVAGSFTFNIDGRGAVGVSGLYGTTDYAERLAGALFTSFRLLGASYVLAEVDLQRRSSDGIPQRDDLATFARLGWFVLESLDLYLEHDWRKAEAARGEADPLSQNRYLAGASWLVLPWLELIPQVRVERFPVTGSYTGGFLQLHAYF